MDNERKHFYAFGPFQLDSKERVLRRDSQPIALTPKAVDTLLVLLENAGHLVEKGDLMKQVWPDAFVEEGNLAKNIFTLRKVLGEYRKGQEYIETVPKRGYRFCAQVTEDSFGMAGAGLVGKRVSRYRVLGILGGGGMGVVYKAEDIKLGRHVALKFLPEELAGNPVAIKRFEREARAASALDQPHICAVYDFDQYEGQPFIAMQYLEGRTIRERIDATRTGEAPFPTEELIEIALQITRALESAHAKGIIHRDIKPANIFLTESGDAKVLDFGVAALQDLELPAEKDPPDGFAMASVESSPSTQTANAQSTSNDLKLTRTGTAMGTASYMSPEQIRGEMLDCRTDLFSFGLVLYEMATGRRAFQGDTTVVMHDAILHQSFVSPRSLNGDIPAGLERIIDRALQKDRTQRYQTAAQIRDDLARLRNPGSRRWMLRLFGLGGATLAILLAVFAAVYDWRSAPTAPRITDPRERRLTSNPPDNPVQGQAIISPDGRYLAYADHLGIHVQTIDTGETTTISEPEGFDPKNFSWSIVDWFPSNKELLVNAEPRVANQNVSMWVAGLSSAPRKLKEAAEAFSVSPDGAWISFVPLPGSPGSVEWNARATSLGERNIWLMGSHGEAPRKLLETSEGRFLAGVNWARDGRHFLYVDGDKDSLTVFSGELNSSSRIPLSSWTSAGLQQLIWLRDGRVLYLNREPGYSDSTCTLWQQRVDPRTGRPVERPARITNWDGFCFYSLSASADSKRLAFGRPLNQMSIAIGDLTATGGKHFAAVPFSVSEGWNNFLDWTADSKSVLFASDRNGKWQIFLQSIGAEDARPLVAGQAALGLSLTAVWGTGAKLSPDDRWLLYFLNNARDPAGKTQVLMRVPVEGGVAEQIAAAARAATLVCSKVKGGSCVMEELTPDRKEIVFTALNPLSGRGREIARIATALLPNESVCGLDDVCYPWSLSPDGEAIAVHGHSSKHFELIYTKTGRRSSFNVHGWSLLDWIPWDPGKNGLFAAAIRGQEAFVLRVGLNGETQVVSREPKDLGIYPAVSPDSRLLALMRWRASTNVWMIDSF
jgi:eukaryotic-like serine/threonine-protein kinase